MDLPLFVVPVKCDADIFLTGPIMCDTVKLSVATDKLPGMLFSNVLDSEGINHNRE